MFNSVSEAIEDLQKRSYCMVEIMDDGSLKVGEESLKSAKELSILDNYNFGKGSDPDEEVDLYTLSTPKGMKGYVVAGFGEHVDSAHARIINHLLRSKVSST
ncbi:MAG: hypothetical protein ABJG78_01815 [Cyclobacteriaceae bacterium]